MKISRSEIFMRMSVRAYESMSVGKNFFFALTLIRSHSHTLIRGAERSEA